MERNGVLRCRRTRNRSWKLDQDWEFALGLLFGIQTVSPRRRKCSRTPSWPPWPSLCLKQTTRPRNWCLRVVCNPWFEHFSMLVILLNCVTLGMFQPCEDVACQSEWCGILQVLDDCIFAFFAVEMVIKMVALGIFGPNCYLGDKWNQLDFVIVMAGVMEYSLDGHNASLSAIRTVRVLRPLRAINRVPSMRILVTLLLDTLPMLGNVLLLCFFVFSSLALWESSCGRGYCATAASWERTSEHFHSE
ncbi:voltage-dependent T-type calcium channel subunit alpha-1H-like [Gymnodraco acuticeps]|uniref:Voltage-dependent T-type calcium channel subunit alpha-1H-like n=1 Tax=Gymnodraco acuticeps TaxID=8218 RepID=A0A6P8V9H1_GYMAC|nr:voltage-dependent T-type calcium channel subunit alpha-1H-like [Gymnodraco acuticeps]